MSYQAWTAEVMQRFALNANPEKAEPMAKYMKNHFQFLGLTSQLRADLLADLLVKANLPDSTSLFVIIHELWSLPEREFQYAALTLLEKSQNSYHQLISPKS